MSKKLKLDFDLENADFDGNPNVAVSAVLQDLAARIERAPKIRVGDKFRLSDANGNTIGACEIVRSRQKN